MSQRPEVETFFADVEAVFGWGILNRDPQDLQIYGRDWSGVLEPRPLAIAFPRSTRDVADLLKLCSKHRVAVVPSGGRTGLSGGAVAAQGELVLSLEKMNRMDAVDIAAQTVRVQAGAVTQAVHEHCAPFGLTWPVDFASKGSSQVGGNLSTNAGGVRVLRYGSTRNWVLSIQLVTMSGEILELNGDLEKNNTGYDLRQLVIGSEGTLGVVTEATLKLAPLVRETQVCFFAVEDMAAVIRLFASARKALSRLSAFECLSLECYQSALSFFRLPAPVKPEGGAFVLLETEDPASDREQLESWLSETFETGLVHDGVLAQSSREASELWKIREGVAESVLARGMAHQHDVSVPISDLPEFSKQIAQKYARDYPEFEVFIFGHIGDGNLHIFIRKPETMDAAAFLARCKVSDSALFEFIRRFKGSVSAEHGIGLLKKAALPYSRPQLEIELLRGIKRVFDPQGLLNPGKIL